jgi:hypothetical protein
MKRIQFAILIAVLVSQFAVAAVIAQTEELTLKMSRDFGYGGFNNDIQGLFSIKITGPADLRRVVFYIDSTAIGEVSQAPFNLQFNTDNYPLGAHNLYAIGFSSSGYQYSSNSIICNFVPASQGTKTALQIVVPLLVIVFGAILLSFIVPLVARRGPFALPLFSLNLGLSKFARCPYCGKWSSVRIQTLAKLQEAERAELEWGRAEVMEETEEEKLRKELDDSKYQAL